MEVLTRAYDNARTGANTRETILTPQKIGGNILVKRFSLFFTDDPRLEAQPLYVPGIKMNDGEVHDVVYVCTMKNNIWAFDANDGKKIWHKAAHLGHAIKPNGTEIDMFGINIHWGILSTPVIDLESNTMYIVNWTSPDGTVHKAFHQLHAVDITSGQIRSSLNIVASADAQGKPGVKFKPSHQKQRA